MLVLEEYLQNIGISFLGFLDVNLVHCLHLCVLRTLKICWLAVNCKSQHPLILGWIRGLQREIVYVGDVQFVVC